MTKRTKEVAKKYTLADLAPKNAKILVLHPKVGDVGAWVEVKPPSSIEYMQAIFDLEKVDLNNIPVTEKLQLAAKLPASVVVAWNEDFFGCEATHDNIINVLSNPANAWILYAINIELGKDENFFTV